MISLFFIEFIRVGGGERFRIDDSQSLDFIYDTASLKGKFPFLTPLSFGEDRRGQNFYLLILPYGFYFRSCRSRRKKIVCR